MHVLLVDSDPGLPRGTTVCLSNDGWTVSTAVDYKGALEIACHESLEAAIVPQPGGGLSAGVDNADFRTLMRALDARRIAVVLIGDQLWQSGLRDDTLIDVAPRAATKEEIRGRLSTIRRYHALVTGMEREVENLQRISKRINQHFVEVDQEMRLAGRLQRDFLPRDLEPIGPVRFAALFRPVTWVSGDIYDIFRIDEKHVGFYVADAVGHGMAASLLTMFIKHAMRVKEIARDGYRVCDPSETLANLDEALSEQALPNCQFVTACYCLLNVETLELKFARGGHPCPLLITPEGCVTELKSQGGLLGVFKGATFSSTTVQLHPGEKVILYTDGMEVSFAPRAGEAHSWEHYLRVFASLAHLPIEQIVRQLEVQLNSETGSLNPTDDVTIVGMEIESG